MSKYSGKCDLYDWVYMKEDGLKDLTLYHNGVRININKPEDLIPYYTHIVGSASCCNGKSTIHIHGKGYISHLRKERLLWAVMDLYPIARKMFKSGKELEVSEIEDSEIENRFNLTKEEISSIIERFNKAKHIIKKYSLPKDYKDTCAFIGDFLIPNYFNDVFIKTIWDDKYISLLKENGYNDFEIMEIIK